LDINRYEKINQFKFENSPASKFHLDYIKKITGDYMGTSLLAFIDLCNHIHENKNMDEIGFYLTPKPGKITFSTPCSFKKGEELNFQYQREINSNKSIFNYGFIYKENPFKNQMIQIVFSRQYFGEEKFEIAKELKLFTDNQQADYFEDYMYNNEKKQSITFDQYLKRNYDYNFFTLLRLCGFLNEQKLTESEVKTRIKLGKPLDYNSEIISGALLRYFIELFHKKSKNIGIVINFFIFF
jgi:nuclear transport factor 2 (NTF2) superfamily protein